MSYSRIRRIGIDAPERTLLHSRIIREKLFLRQLYAEWYSIILDLTHDKASGCLVELGAGGGFSKQVIPDVMTTEVLPVPGVDLRADGEALPFKENTLKGLFMIDVFHHLPGSERFLNEAARCVKPGGVVVMIEPWNTPLSRFVYRYLHHEPFDAATPDWRLTPGGPLSRANSALPWIVFDRDRRVFERKWPEWQIDTIELHTPFRYLLSGGLSIRSLMPAALFGFWRGVEKRLQPLMGWIALFATIVLIRRAVTA